MREIQAIVSKKKIYWPRGPRIRAHNDKDNLLFYYLLNIFFNVNLNLH